MQLIYLDVDDDLVSICDRLMWVKDEARLLLVLPDEGRVLEEWLDLVRLRRQAETLRLEIGLVTLNGLVQSQARALGFPTFASVKGAEGGRRGWWRGRRGWHRPTRPGAIVQLGSGGRSLKSLPDEADRREMYRRMTPRLGWQRWLWRYAGIMLFFLTLAVVFIGVAYSVPTATITLQPQVEALRVERQIVADPQLETVNFSGASVPGRLLVVAHEWQADVATTGTIDVPDAPARGRVVFVNLLDEAVAVPAGTRVSTSDGNNVTYQVIDSIEVPGVVGGTAEADIVAIESGPQGNANANLVNRIEGTLGLQLEVRNLEPVTGGAVRSVPAVSQSDQERLRSQVIQHLQALAIQEMEASLTENEFLARDSLRVISIYHETYSYFVGEQTDRLALEIRAELHGTAVDASQATDLVYQELVGSVGVGWELMPNSLVFRNGDVLGVDSQGRVSFVMIGEAQVAARLDLGGPITHVVGQDTEIALAYLNEQLPLRAYPAARVWPSWFDRLPYLPARIQTMVE